MLNFCDFYSGVCIYHKSPPYALLSPIVLLVLECSEAILVSYIYPIVQILGHQKSINFPFGINHGSNLSQRDRMNHIYIHMSLSRSSLTI